MKINTNIIAVVAVIALLVGIWAKVTPATVINSVQTPFGAVSNTNAPASNTVLVNGTLLPNPSVLDYFVARTFLYTDKALGLGNSSGVPILLQGIRVAMGAATTTPCALQNPYATATSTFQDVSLQVTVGTSTAGVFAIGTSTTAYATSTSIGSGTVAANAQNTITFAGAANNNQVAPGAYITFGVSGVPYGFTYTGSCKAVFVSTN